MSRDPKATAARVKVLRALELIEQAQNTLNDAAASLCPVKGAVKHYDRIGDLARTVSDAWHALNRQALETFSLDHEPRVDCKCGCAAIAKAEGRTP